MSDIGRTNASGRSWPWLAVLLIALPFLYVLSVGPVARITIEARRSDLALVEKLYAPVIWLHAHTSLKKPLESYLEFWGAD